MTETRQKINPMEEENQEQLPAVLRLINYGIEQGFLYDDIKDDYSIQTLTRILVIENDDKQIGIGALLDAMTGFLSVMLKYGGSNIPEVLEYYERGYNANEAHKRFENIPCIKPALMEK